MPYHGEYDEETPHRDRYLEHWLDEIIPVVPALYERVVGGKFGPLHTRRVELLYPLVRQLGFRSEALTQVGLEVIDKMISPLGDVLNARNIDWVSLLDQDEHHFVARRCVEDLEIEDVARAIVEFRCGDSPLRCKASEAKDALAKILEDRLAGRLAKFFAASPKKGRVKAS
jgi:hypothetical protein